MTDKGRQEQRLKILQHKPAKYEERKLKLKIETEEEKYQRLYLLLLSLEPSQRADSLPTEEDLDKFLSEIHASRDDIILKRLKRFFRRVDKTIVTTFEPISVTQIFKHERPTKEGYQLIHYVYNLLGISVSEILDPHLTVRPPIVTNIGFTRQEVEEGIELLQGEGLIEPIAEYKGEMRYRYSDESLRPFIKDCVLFLGYVKKQLAWQWFHLRSPSKYERKWLEILFGRRLTDTHLQNMFNIRRSINKKKKKRYLEKLRRDGPVTGMLIYLGIQEIKETHADVIQKYGFPSQKIMDLVYPTFLEKLPWFPSQKIMEEFRSHSFSLF